MTKFIDLTGQKFGDWTVVSLNQEENNKERYWNCICKCGNEKKVSERCLKYGGSFMCKSCKYIAMGNPLTRPGTIFGTWTIISRDPNKLGYSICKCNCGKVVSVQTQTMRKGQSSGCNTCRTQRLKTDHSMMIGRLFYKWTVLEYVSITIKGHKRGRYKCQCKCGFIQLIKKADLINLQSSQCITCHNRSR